MRARKLIVETLLKEAVEEDQIAAAALEDVFDQLEKDIKANKDKLIPQQQNEAVGVALMGGALAAPVMIKLVGKAVRSLQNLLAKRKDEEPVDTNAIIDMGKKLHDLYIKGLEKSLFFIKDDKKRKRLAVIIFHAVIAGMLVVSGKGFFKALAKHQSLTAFLEALLSAIKTGELGLFAAESFGSLATALGTATELSDAIELADMTDVTEISTMAGGSVQGYSLPLGKKPEDYKMENKLRITKGRLRQILAEEVARHNKLNETKTDMLEEMGVAEEEAEAASFAAQAKGAAATKAGAEGADAFYEGEELEETTHDDLIEGDFVNILAGVLTGAIGKVLEFTKTIDGNDALVVRLTKDADMKVYGKSGDEVIVQPRFVEKDQGMYSMTTMEEGMHTGDPKAPPMSAAVFIDMIATKLGMSKEDVVKKMGMAMADIQAAEDSAARAGMSPSAGERERFDTATDGRFSDEFETYADMKYAMAQRDKMEEDKHAGMTTAKFADMFDLNMQQDNDGQTIFYASSEPGPKLKELIRQARAAGYSMENNNDGSITIYTGEHSSGDKMEEEAKPDFLDLDGDGDKEESMKKAAADKDKLKKEVRAMLDEMLTDD